MVDKKQVKKKGQEKKEDKYKYKYLEDVPYKAMDWIGSTTSLIVHTILFVIIFGLNIFGVSYDRILLVLTTAVSLEAIYLAIFIQMSVNKTSQSLQDVEEDIEEIQEDVEDIQEDVEDLGEDMDEIQEDIDEIQQGDEEDEVSDKKTQSSLSTIETKLQGIMGEIERMKNGKKWKFQITNNKLQTITKLQITIPKLPFFGIYKIGICLWFGACYLLFI